MSDNACKHIGQSVICPYCRERVLMCPASESDAARQDAETVRQRVVTIADEAFGPFPVQSADDALTYIERGIFAASQDAEMARGLLLRAYNVCFDEVESLLENGANPTDVFGMEECSLVLAIGELLNLPKGRASLATPTPGPVPPEALAVLRDTSITLPGEELAINAALDSGVRITEAMQQVIARGCRACMQAEHPYWHPADRPCPKSDTP